MRAIVMKTLRQAGYGDHTLEEAGNGIEALKAIRASAPDLVLADWHMPEMSGIELLRALRTHGPAVKLGFVTSEGSPEARKMAADDGALFVIAKPFTVATFKAVLASVLTP